jgi:hypothetical protein
MDLPPPVQDPERRDDADDPGRRMAAVEAELIALGARLEQLEASLQQAVREETRRASNEIRHTVSELGRRLALDLPQFLDRHRLLIVNELRGGGAAAAAATAPTSAPPAADAPTGAPDPTVAAADDEDDEPSADDPGGGRRKRRRRKEG